MSKLKEVFETLRLATLYSLRFCWRNAPFETVIRILTMASLALFGYLKIKAIGVVISALQKEHGSAVTASFWQSETAHALVWMVSMIAFGIVLGRMNWYFRSRSNQKLRFANMKEINVHRATLDVARFKSKTYDDLQSKIEELGSGWGTRMTFAQDLYELGATIMTFFVFGLAILSYSPLYTLIICLASIPLMSAEFIAVNKFWIVMMELVPHNKARTVLQKAYINPWAFMQMLMFDQNPVLQRQIGDNRDYQLKRYEEIRRSIVMREIFTHLLSAVGVLLVIFHAIWSVWVDHGDIGRLSVLIASIFAFQGSLEGIMQSLADQWNNAKGVILIEKEFFGLKPLLVTMDRIQPTFGRPPHIILDKVSFAYPESDTLVLKDITLSIKPGEKVAIVGRSGSGKTSLQNLLLRHYDPTSGSIYAEGIDLRRIDPQDWTKTVSSLTQKVSILERQVADEIASSALHRPTDMEEVAGASRFAAFDEVVAEEPKGFQTQIGTDFGGKDFSGGEERRLALARVRYKGTPILILDEPDSGLDPETAEKVMDNVFALSGVTVIVITHHVSRAQRCDHVVMLERGEIIEEGSHVSLMSRHGAYAQMFEKDQKRLQG